MHDLGLSYLNINRSNYEKTLHFLTTRLISHHNFQSSSTEKKTIDLETFESLAKLKISISSATSQPRTFSGDIETS